MKLRIRDKSETPEPVLDVWLEPSSVHGELRLCGQRISGEATWIAAITERGIRLYGSADPLGLPTDAAGRAKVIE